MDKLNNDNNSLNHYNENNDFSYNNTSSGNLHFTNTNDDENNTEVINLDKINAENNVLDESNTNENNNVNNANIETNNNYSTSTETLKNTSYYTESFKNKITAKKKFPVQTLIVALISSIVGGAVVAALFLSIPLLRQPGSGLNKLLGTVYSDPSMLKKVEIVSADSPVAAIAEKVSPSIVGIRTKIKTSSLFGSGTGMGEGSGIIIRRDGYIMTNYHVIADEDGKTSGSKIEVYLPNQKDKSYAATIIGGDSRTDLAVIKIDVENLPAAELGNSDEIKVGDLAIAIGNPGGLEYMGSVTAGIISGLNRVVPLENNKEFKLIQTDAAINPGNSGGALCNAKGQVIGVNTVKIGAQGYEGLGFAIPINKAKEITDSLIQYKYVKGRPLLGIIFDTRYTEEYAKKFNLPVGVLVNDVTPLSGAYVGGVKKGDIITKFDGQPVKDGKELDELKNKHKPGDTVQIEVYRLKDDDTGEYITLSIKLGEDKGY